MYTQSTYSVLPVPSDVLSLQASARDRRTSSTASLCATRRRTSSISWSTSPYSTKSSRSTRSAMRKTLKKDTCMFVSLRRSVSLFNYGYDQHVLLTCVYTHDVIVLWVEYDRWHNINNVDVYCVLYCSILFHLCILYSTTIRHTLCALTYYILLLLKCFTLFDYSTLHYTILCDSATSNII